MNADERRSNEITEQIIGCAFNVANELGIGFLEKVYENALFVELTKAGLRVRAQAPTVVRYRGVVVGEYFADLLVEDCALVELKCAEGIDDAHVAQCLNYLRATGLHVCLLLNFGKKKLQAKRLVREI